ncbi:OmpA family protein [Shimia sp. R11_0]|uniref:OmpA family protein n=1 Tax=Shimia sp. R11_0 TaxID=2821096 RepID=UPI001ADA8498|nr:OmpA family protein [Shimia sp. R11_0]MBO9478214.1 OmpA family protein [Shimia sp. R11_0]
MRFFGFRPIALGLCGLLSTPGAWALSPDEICSQMQAAYGVPAENCPLLTSEPVPAAQTPAASALPDDIEESHIFFPSGGARLDDTAKVKLATVAAVLESAPMRTACLRLTGHSDTIGSAQTNQALALRRAEAVAEALKIGLTDKSRILDVRSLGETLPLPDIPSNSRRNRRVTIEAKTCP